MTNYFAWLADELTEIEERLSEPDLVMFSGRLRRAINKAFERACEAGREQRQAKEAGAAAVNARKVSSQSRTKAPSIGDGRRYIGEGRTFSRDMAEPALAPSPPAPAPAHPHRADGPSPVQGAAAAPLR